MQKLFLGVAIVALLFIAALLSLRAYYVVVALVAGGLMLRHRELWSLVRHRRLPPLDERVRQNMGKAVRNGFVFFVLASACLMVFFTINRSARADVVHVLGALLVSGGMAYFFSYVFHDRVEPSLSERSLAMLKTFLIVAGTALGAFVVSVVLHNVLSGLLGTEEPVFFIIAVLIAPLAFLVGILGSLVFFLRGLLNGAA